MTRKLLTCALAALAFAAVSASPIVATDALACGCCAGQKAGSKSKMGCMGGDTKASKGGMSCMKGMDMGGMENMSVAQKESDDAMMSGMDHSKMDMGGADSAGSTEYADVVFAKAMIPHHEAAVEMAKQLLKSGKNEELKAMANEIIAAQNKEIKSLYGWLAKNAN